MLGTVIDDGDDVAVAAITVAELKVGVQLADGNRRERRERFVEAVLDAVSIEPYDLDVAEVHAVLLAHARQAGKPRGAHDLIIAATARARGRKVVSGDRSGFAELPGVSVAGFDVRRDVAGTPWEVQEGRESLTGFERDGAMEIAGRRFAWRALGEGPPLLLVQGYAGSADDWPPDFLAALGRSFSLIAPDNRGMGDSELGDPAELTMESMAADLEALLDELAIERIAVLGFSMGGFIAQALAARVPQRVESLALFSTDPGSADAVRADPADWARLVDHSGTPRERASRAISILFPPSVAPEMDREFGEIAAEAQAALDPAALVAEERAMEQWWEVPPPCDDAPPIAPVLIAHGAEDVVIPAANAELLAARFPAAQIELFAGAGHAVLAQEPAAAAKLIASRL